MLIRFGWRKISSKWLFWSAIAGWLLFFPNAPYILTDIFHLKPRHGIPLWYDLIMILSTAWCGLLLGMFSLLNIQAVMQEKFGWRFSWLFSVIVIWLCSYGIWIGRYWRWNSWDIFTNPFGVLEQSLNPFLSPFSHGNIFLMTALFSMFLLFTYLVLRNVVGKESPVISRERHPLSGI